MRPLIYAYLKANRQKTLLFGNSSGSLCRDDRAPCRYVPDIAQYLKITKRHRFDVGIGPVSSTETRIAECVTTALITELLVNHQYVS